MLEMLVIRKTSKLFRLRTADEIKKAVSFYNVGPEQIPGLIVERIANTDKFCLGASEAVVLVNATPQTQTLHRSRVQEAAAAASSRAGALAGSGGAHLEVPEQHRHVHDSTAHDRGVHRTLLRPEMRATRQAALGVAAAQCLRDELRVARQRAAPPAR